MAKAEAYQGPRVDGVSQSMLTAFFDCEERHRLSLEGWQTPGTKDAFTFGSTWHWMMEQDVRAYIAGNAPYAGKALSALWKRSAQAKAIEAEEQEQILAKAIPMREGYLKKHGKQDARRIWLEPEQVFDVALDGYRLRGCIDGIVRKGRSGKPWIVERKTTSGDVGDSYHDLLNFDFQSMFYLTAGEIHLGEKIGGILYDVTRKPTIRQKQNESLAEYSKRIEEAYVGDPDRHFARYEIAVGKKRREEFVEELQKKLSRYSAWFSAGCNSVRNESACVKRWKCEYIPICAGGGTAGFVQTGRLFSELEEEE